MKVEVKRVRRYWDTNDGRFSFCYQKVGELKPCCLGMDEAIEEKVIGFGENDGGSCNTYQKMAIWYTMWEDSRWELLIDFCPWCGEKIECVVVEKVIEKIHQREEIHWVPTPYEVDDPEE